MQVQHEAGHVKALKASVRGVSLCVPGIFIFLWFKKDKWVAVLMGNDGDIYYLDK